MSTWLPSLNALRAFEAAARHLSYSAAADELNVTPAAVKQLVAKLEASVGSRLLARKGRTLTLTASGEAGLNDLAAAMQHLTASVRQMRAPQDERRLIVSVETSIATTWLVPKLAGFRESYPDVNVLIESTPRIVDLQRGETDIALRYAVESDKGLVIHRLFDDQIFPACSPSLAKGPPRLRHLSDLNTRPLIHWDLSTMDWARSTRQWFVWDNWLAHVGAERIDTAGGLHFSDYGLAVQAAIAGHGVVLASGPILRESLEANLLVRPFDELAAPGIGYDVVTSQERQDRPEVRAFIAWLLEAAQIV